MNKLLITSILFAVQASAQTVDSSLFHIGANGRLIKADTSSSNLIIEKRVGNSVQYGFNFNGIFRGTLPADSDAIVRSKDLSSVAPLDVSGVAGKATRSISTPSFSTVRTGTTVVDMVDQFTGESFTVTSATTRGFNHVIVDADVDNIVIFKLFGSYYKRNGQLNITNFGLCHQGAGYDDAAVNANLSYIRAELAASGVCPPLVLPSGNTFKFQNSINLTNLNGITVEGGGGRYINTIVQSDAGDGRAAFDFTASRSVLIKNITITSSGITGASVGVLFALGMNPRGSTNQFQQVGGLNNMLDNVYIIMDNQPTKNNNIGNVAFLDIRSEECSINNLSVQANVGILMSNTSDMTYAGVVGQLNGADYSIASQYFDIAKYSNSGDTTAFNGSMGVVSCTGQNSILGYSTNHNIILVTANSFSYHGYLVNTGTQSGAANNGDASMGIYGLCQNIHLDATIEGSSTALQLHYSSIFSTSTVTAVVANSGRSNVSDFPFVLISDNSTFDGNTIRLASNNTAAWQRYLIATTAQSDNSVPVNVLFSNNTLSCKELTDPKFLCTNLLMKVSNNNTFNGAVAYRNNGSWVEITSPVRIMTGRFTSNAFYNVAAFTNTNTPSMAAGMTAGFYRVKIDGVVKDGNYNSGGITSASFTAEMMLSVNGNYGSPNPLAKTVVYHNQGGYTDNGSIIDIDCNLVNSSGKWYVQLKTMGANATGEELWFTGNVSIMSDFITERAVPTNL